MNMSKVRSYLWIGLLGLLSFPSLSATDWTPVVDLKFENNLTNSGSLGEELGVNWKDTHVYAPGKDGAAAGFSLQPEDYNNYVKSARGVDSLVAMSGVSLSLDIKPDSLQNKRMRPLWMHGAYGVQIHQHKVAFVFYTQDQGIVWDVQANAADLYDGNWHNIQGTYDSETGTASLLIDGTLVSEIYGLSGAIPDPGNRSLTIGSDTWSKPFVGLIDNVVIASADAEPPVVKDSIGQGFDCDLNTYDYCQDDHIEVVVNPLSGNGNNGNDLPALFRWEFSSDQGLAIIGKFANGDYWVAPASGRTNVTIRSLTSNGKITADADPIMESLGLLDGSNNYGNYNSSENIIPTLPVSYSSATSLVAAVQRDEADSSECGTKQIVGECVDAYQVLTVLPEIPAGYGKNLLRPPVTGTSKELLSLGDFDFDRLPANENLMGTDAEGLEKIRVRWSHTLNIFSLLNSEIKGYSEGGRAYRPHILVDDYASGMARQYHDDLMVLFSADHSLAEMQHALAAVLVFGLDMYAAMHENGGVVRYYGSGAGQHTGKFLPPVIAAALLKDPAKAKVLSSVSTSTEPNNAVRPQEIEQINPGVNGPVWGDMPDNLTDLQIGGYWGSMLKSQCFDGATGTCDPKIGKKTARDPYGYIDGPPNLPGTSYMSVTIGPLRAFVATMFLMPEVCEIINYQPVIEYVDRVHSTGIQTQPDNCAPPDPRESLSCDAYRQKDCEYYGLSNTGTATWGPDPMNPEACITNGSGQAGRFPAQQSADLNYGYASRQVEDNWAALRWDQPTCGW